jgi:hypothetical protein
MQLPIIIEVFLDKIFDSIGEHDRGQGEKSITYQLKTEMEKTFAKNLLSIQRKHTRSKVQQYWQLNIFSYARESFTKKRFR